MARKESPILTDAELRLMNVIWARGASTVNDVLEALDHDPPLAYSTVLTTLRILEEKGYLDHQKDGRAFVYSPCVPREEAQQSALQSLLSRFFSGSAELLVHNLLSQEKLNRSELKRLKKMIGEAN